MLNEKQGTISHDPKDSIPFVYALNNLEADILTFYRTGQSLAVDLHRQYCLIKIGRLSQDMDLISLVQLTLKQNNSDTNLLEIMGNRSNLLLHEQFPLVRRILSLPS